MYCKGSSVMCDDGLLVYLLFLASSNEITLFFTCVLSEAHPTLDRAAATAASNHDRECH